MKEKENNWGVLILLTIICLFTGNWTAGLLTIPFWILGGKFLFPLITDLVFGKFNKKTKKDLMNNDIRLFGLMACVVMYLMIIWNIIEGLIVSFGTWSILLTIIYVVIPIIKIILLAKKR